MSCVTEYRQVNSNNLTALTQNEHKQDFFFISVCGDDDDWGSAARHQNVTAS